MTTQPQLGAEYIQFDDSRPCESLRFLCAVEDLEKTETMHGKLPSLFAIFSVPSEWKYIILSFGLGASAAGNYIVGIPTIKLWRSVFDFDSNQIIAKSIKKKFTIIYEATNYGLPNGISFLSSDFV